MMKIQTHFALFGALLGLVALAGARDAAAQNLDLGSLAAFSYVGRDAGDNKTPCNLNVSEIGRDFSGRYFQDFRAWVNNRPELNFSLRLKGSDRYRTPEVLAGSSAQFGVAIEGFKLVLIADVNNPTQVSEFRLMDATGLSATPLIRCTSVRSIPR